MVMHPYSFIIKTQNHNGFTKFIKQYKMQSYEISE